MWRDTWLEPKFWIFDASIIFLFPLLLLALVMADLGAWFLVAIISVVLFCALVFYFYIALALKMSVTKSLLRLKVKILGPRRPARNAVYTLYNYDPFGMSAWRVPRHSNKDNG